ncbi:MAG: ATP-binding cassette domain-containing protein [Propionibacteriaceae bacterium]|nr:ATP-binding cassette domain-containing protein [Propionibacteriaceae bacterium]
MLDSTPAPLAIEVRGLKKTFPVRTRGAVPKPTPADPGQDGASASPPGQPPTPPPKQSRRGAFVEAVSGIDLDVPHGQVFAFLGPNGAGKTTTLRILTTLLPATSGTAKVAGFDVTTQQRQVRRNIGYVGQLGGTDLDHATGRENLVLAARLYGLRKRDALTRAAELLEGFDLTALADQETSTYSGGQRRRLDVALGMVGQPSVLFLDEPSTGLDPQNRMNLWDQVRRLRAAGTTVFLTTHYLDEADALADNVAIMDHGQIIARGTPAELKARTGSTTLDDVFLTLTGRVLRDTESQEVRS